MCADMQPRVTPNTSAISGCDLPASSNRLIVPLSASVSRGAARLPRRTDAQVSPRVSHARRHDPARHRNLPLRSQRRLARGRAGLASRARQLISGWRRVARNEVSKAAVIMLCLPSSTDLGGGKIEHEHTSGCHDS